MHWEVTAGYGTKLLCKDYGDNVGGAASKAVNLVG